MSLTVPGWGSGEDAQLDRIVAVVYPAEFCSQAYSEAAARKIVPNLFTEDVLCGGDPMGEAGTCNGDSGKICLNKINLTFNKLYSQNYKEEAVCILIPPGRGSFWKPSCLAVLCRNVEPSFTQMCMLG